MTVRPIGGEMPAWSDLDGHHGPGPVRGAALAPLLATIEGRTLVAGPHDPALLDSLPATDLTLLVRGRPDAEALAARYAERQDIAVWCGSPEKLAARPPFDTIVVLDGLSRLSSVEGGELTWADAFDLLFAALRPGGRLMLGVENFAGLHRLAGLPPALTDSDWVITGGYDPTRPAGLRQVIARLAGTGTGAIRAYAAYPAPVAPTVLLGPEILGDDDRRGFVAATLSRACTPPASEAGAGTWTDPARIAVDAARHGLAADLAPGWIIVAERGPASAGSVVMPEAVIATGGEAHIIAAGSAPIGRTLEDHLIMTCLRRDLPALRALFRAWQSGADAAVDAGQVIVGLGGRHTPLMPGSDPDAVIRAFATTLVRNGFAHPWAASADANGVATAIAVMIGRNPGPAPVDRPTRPSLRELTIERDRLDLAVTEARARIAWYEQTLSARDDALRHARHLIDLLTARGPAGAGKALMAGAKSARRTARVVLQGIRPRP